jgi:hypothetical protein
MNPLEEIPFVSHSQAQVAWRDSQDRNDGGLEHFHRPGFLDPTATFGAWLRIVTFGRVVTGGAPRRECSFGVSALSKSASHGGPLICAGARPTHTHGNWVELF